MEMQGSLKAELDCIQQFSETNFTDGLNKIDVPIADSAMRSAELVKGSILKVYARAPHGLAGTHQLQLNEDLPAFIKG